MTIVHTVQGQTIRVAIKGDLDLKTADPLRDALDKLIDRYREKNLTVDLSDVDFVDSSGLGVILGRYRRLAAQSRTIALVGVKPSVKAVLELAGIDSIMPVSDWTRSHPETATPN
ncbi:STAS domain-containing protein [Sulfobacillus harzensis]|uniref:Anti-sigma factor antagonist n=1 Tax=Sulfobacillus harzensis TaxID=2729629 RepID=A0A7Y0L825_9FIRM|nr:anti-sigma factor antagonist [Sulfobacillus harzensis]NMP24165.1 anti-sigma factor antagonist [Sulfobacillus harzensis]